MLEDTIDVLGMIKDANLTSAQVLELMRKLKGEKIVKTKTPSQHGPAKKITEITRTYNCAHCGARWTTVVKLTGMDQIAALDKAGKCQLVTVAGPYIIDSWVHSCSNCAHYVDKMALPELQRRYLETLKYVPLPRDKECEC